MLGEYHYDKESIDDIDFQTFDQDKLLQMINEVVFEDQTDIKLSKRNLKK